MSFSLLLLFFSFFPVVVELQVLQQNNGILDKPPELFFQSHKRPQNIERKGAKSKQIPGYRQLSQTTESTMKNIIHAPVDYF